MPYGVTEYYAVLVDGDNGIEVESSYHSTEADAVEHVETELNTDWNSMIKPHSEIFIAKKLSIHWVDPEE